MAIATRPPYLSGTALYNLISSENEYLNLRSEKYRCTGIELKSSIRFISFGKINLQILFYDSKTK